MKILKKDYAASTSNAAVTYTANDLNQYDSTTYPTEAFTYDDAGNLTQDDTFDYTWDAENRLIRVETRIDWGQNSTAYEVDDKRVYFSYDYMGRRVRKRVETFNGTSWPETGDELFVYDGWNVVMVLNANEQNEVMREYTWGLDLSATVHGAGGIGGLLAAVETQGTSSELDDKRYWFLYDANGNVGQVLDATDTGNISIAAHYEYDPYGNLIHSSGPYKDANPFRFSTKWFDEETHLGYWGYRYYSPRLGRWISRDPIGEKGGLNLCVFALNGPTNHVDALGFQALPPDSWYPAPTETTCPTEIYVYIDGHGCMAEGEYTGQIGKGNKGCSSGDYVSPKDVKQATDAVLRQYDATSLAKAKVVLVLRTCGMGNHVPEMRQLASGHRSIKTVCGCTSLYWATGGWGWCWSKWVCTNVNGF